MGTAGETSGDVTNHSRERYYRTDVDFYTEPEWCVEALLDAEKFDGFIYDPAAGAGTIIRVCRRRGLWVMGADLIGRDVTSVAGGVNFLSDEPMLPLHHVICNPPFRDALKFIERALHLASGKIAMLVQAKFLFSERRRGLFVEDPPATIYFLSNRPSMPPGDLLMRGEIKATGGKLDYVWLVWPTYHLKVESTTCRWLAKPLAKQPT